MHFLHSQKCSKLFLTSLLLLAFALPANSAENMDDQWDFQLATYAWLAGQKGTVKTYNNLPKVDVDIDFWDDIAGNINGALFLLGEVRKGAFGLFLDLAYTDIDIENATPGSLFTSASSRTESWLMTPAAFYRLSGSETYFLDLLVGARFMAVESTLIFSGGLLPGRESNNSKNWVDPLVGVKGLTALGSSNFFMSGAALIGGFGAGSDLMWDVSFNMGYKWGEMFSTTIGYRYLDIDYESNGFIYDVSQDGPTIGLSWRF
ncbi:hypothetical protein [Desulforhopalus sp. 52FAK]